MKEISHFEEIQIIDKIDFILNDADIEALKNGKIINASVECEYAITLRYEVK